MYSLISNQIKVTFAFKLTPRKYNVRLLFIDLHSTLGFTLNIEIKLCMDMEETDTVYQDKACYKEIREQTKLHCQ